MGDSMVQSKAYYREHVKCPFSNTTNEYHVFEAIRNNPSISFEELAEKFTVYNAVCGLCACVNADIIYITNMAYENRYWAKLQPV